MRVLSLLVRGSWLCFSSSSFSSSSSSFFYSLGFLMHEVRNSRFSSPIDINLSYSFEEGGEGENGKKRDGKEREKEECHFFSTEFVK